MEGKGEQDHKREGGKRDKDNRKVHVLANKGQNS